jgi:hypothetical protein
MDVEPGFVCHSDLRPGQEVTLFVNNECQMLQSMRMVQQSLDSCKPRRRGKVGESTKTPGQQMCLRRICYSSGSKSSYSDFVPVAGSWISAYPSPQILGVKHVGSVPTRVNSERKLSRRSSSRFKFVSSLCSGYSLLSTTRIYME